MNLPVLVLPAVPTLNISDCHHGAGLQDDYTQRPALLQSLEAAVVDGQDWLADHPGALAILHGDVVNGVDQGLDACLGHWATLEALRLYARLRQPRPVAGHDGRPIWIEGNHDAGVGAVVDSRPCLDGFMFARAAIVGQDYHCHGHEWDWACDGAWGWIGRACSRIAGQVGGLSPEVEDKLRAMGGRDSDHEAFRRTVTRDIVGRNRTRLRRGQTIIGRIVCGHSHERACRDLDIGGGLRYYNLGRGGQDGFVRIVG